jgi:hypothetical protein
MKTYLNKISKEQALEILKKVIGPSRRELKGEEYDHTWLILNLLDPVEISNNQRSITEVYHQNGKIFHVHYFTMNESPMIEEVGSFDS